MANRKFMLCQYPSQGFGGKCGKFYLLNQFGTRFDIEDEYDKQLDEMNKVVRIDDSMNGTFCASTIDELVKVIEETLDTKIERW